MSDEVPTLAGWLKPMTAPRAGSDKPKVATTPKPTPRPRPAGLCPGCERPTCWDKGCVLAAGQAAADADAHAVAAPLAPPAPPAPSPTPAPTAAPIAMPTPAPTPAPAPAARCVSAAQADPTGAFARAQYGHDLIPTGPDGGVVGVPRAPAFDVWTSAVTGQHRIVGATVEADGSVTLTPGQMETLCRAGVRA